MRSRLVGLLIVVGMLGGGAGALAAKGGLPVNAFSNGQGSANSQYCPPTSQQPGKPKKPGPAKCGKPKTKAKSCRKTKSKHKARNRSKSKSKHKAKTSAKVKAKKKKSKTKSCRNTRRHGKARGKGKNNGKAHGKGNGKKK
jgi:hypothetical protein